MNPSTILLTKAWLAACSLQVPKACNAGELSKPPGEMFVVCLSRCHADRGDGADRSRTVQQIDGNVGCGKMQCSWSQVCLKRCEYCFRSCGPPAEIFRQRFYKVANKRKMQGAAHMQARALTQADREAMQQQRMVQHVTSIDNLFLLDCLPQGSSSSRPPSLSNYHRIALHHVLSQHR